MAKVPNVTGVVGAASGVIGAGINAISQARQNKKEREFATEMYQTQKKDEREFWAMQNEYNSPQAQMQRLQEAGLNPAMMYGQGNTGNAGGLHAPQAPKWTPQAPQYGNAFGAIPKGIQDIYDIELKQAQTDNLKKQGSVLVADKLLKMANTLNVNTKTQQGKFDLDLAKDLRHTSLQAAQEELRTAQISNEYKLSENERQNIRLNRSVIESVEKVLTMRLERSKTVAEKAKIRQTIEAIKKDNKLRDLDIELRKMGINPNSKMYSQIVGRIINRAQQEHAGKNTFLSGFFDGLLGK